MQPSFNVFVHKEPEVPTKRERYVVRPGVLKLVDSNKWELLWGNRSWFFTDQDVRLFAAGGTVLTSSYGRVSLSLKACDALNFLEFLRDRPDLEVVVA